MQVDGDVLPVVGVDVVHLLAGLAAAAAGRDVLLQPRVEVVLVLLVRRVGPLQG